MEVDLKQQIIQQIMEATDQNKLETIRKIFYE